MIDTGTTLALIVVLWAAALGTRGSFIVFLADLRLPPLLQRGLRFVPPAVFAALVAPELLLAKGSLSLSPGNEKLVAGIVAAVVAWRTRNTLATVLVGMVILHGVRYLR